MSGDGRRHRHFMPTRPDCLDPLGDGDITESVRRLSPRGGLICVDRRYIAPAPPLPLHRRRDVAPALFL